MLLVFWHSGHPDCKKYDSEGTTVASQHKHGRESMCDCVIGIESVQRCFTKRLAGLSNVSYSGRLAIYSSIGADFVGVLGLIQPWTPITHMQNSYFVHFLSMRFFVPQKQKRPWAAGGAYSTPSDPLLIGEGQAYSTLSAPMVLWSSGLLCSKVNEPPPDRPINSGHHRVINWLFLLSSYLPMDLVHLLLLDLPSGTTYLNICVILNFW